MSEYTCKHHINCNCHGDLIINKEAEENSRRNFLKLATTVGLGFSLIPAVMGSTAQEEGKEREIDGNNAIKKGKAKKITFLHTADIHGQLMTHDEFFLEKGEVIYKKRGGLANLKTLVTHYRKQNPENTLLLDGG